MKLKIVGNGVKWKLNSMGGGGSQKSAFQGGGPFFLEQP